MYFNGSVLKMNNAVNSSLTFRKLSKFTRCAIEAVDLNYTCYEKYNGGSADPPVMILHGLLSSLKSWTWMSEMIHRETGRTVINVDARNHGGSPHCPRNTYIHMAYDTLKLIKKLQLPKVTLLGQSMGGRTAMTLSLLYPDIVSSLIVVDISPLSMPQHMYTDFPAVLDTINKIDFKGNISIDEAIRHATRQLQTSGITQKAVINFILKNLGIKLDNTVGWVPNMEILRQDYHTLLEFPDVPGEFSEPTLFIKAEQTDFLSLEEFPRIKHYYPKAQLKIVPGSGHNIQEQNPTALLKFTMEFLMKN